MKEYFVSDPEKSLEWWQDGVIYQILPRSFKDSNGDGIGDLKGIEEKAEYLSDLGIRAVWLTPIFESPMVDFGYDVSDFYSVASIFGTMDDFRSLKRKLESLDIKLILDIVPNHTSNECEWFKKSENCVEPFTNFYVWKDAAGWTEDSKPIPPNNWVSLFNGPAWEWSPVRKQFYLHHFAVQQPDLNFRNELVVTEIEKILTYWMDEGVDGFRMDSVNFLLEHPAFPDEPVNESYTKCSSIMTHDSLIHTYSKDWSENYELVRRFQNIIHSYSEKDGKTRVVINEAYASFENTMKYYEISSGKDMPFNFSFIADIDCNSNARDFARIICKWLENVPKNCWLNWVIGNHDNSRIASRLRTELVDAMNMVNLLLPGTATTYYGEELGMTDTILRWDQTLDPGARMVGIKRFKEFSRDPARTPFQWDASISAGFSSNPVTWLPLNPNYWKLNVEAQKKEARSHYHVYRSLVKLRSHPSVRKGKIRIHLVNDWILAFIRFLDGAELILVVINFGSEDESVNLSACLETLPEVLTVHISSVNSEHNVETVFKTDTEFTMRPKSSLVLTSQDNKQLE